MRELLFRAFAVGAVTADASLLVNLPAGLGGFGRVSRSGYREQAQVAHGKRRPNTDFGGLNIGRPAQAKNRTGGTAHRQRRVLNRSLKNYGRSVKPWSQRNPPDRPFRMMLPDVAVAETTNVRRSAERHKPAATAANRVSGLRGGMSHISTPFPNGS